MRRRDLIKDRNGEERLSKRKQLLTKTLNINMKNKVVKPGGQSVALYGSETWALKKGDTNRLEAFEMWM